MPTQPADAVLLENGYSDRHPPLMVSTASNTGPFKRSLLAMLGCIVGPIVVLAITRVIPVLNLPEGVEVGVFLTGFVLFFVLALMAVILGLGALRQRRHQRPIREGRYLWGKALTNRQIEHVQNQQQTQRKQFLQALFNALALILTITTIVMVLTRPEGVSVARSLGSATASVLFLILVCAAIGSLTFWIMRQAGPLSGPHRHVVVTDDGLLLEPVFLPWTRLGMSLTSVAVQSQNKQPTIDFTYSIAMRGGATRRHCYSVPLDVEDIAQATQLANLLQTHCTAAAD